MADQALLRPALLPPWLRRDHAKGGLVTEHSDTHLHDGKLTRFCKKIVLIILVVVEQRAFLLLLIRRNVFN